MSWMEYGPIVGWALDAHLRANMTSLTLGVALAENKAVLGHSKEVFKKTSR